jgi:hypothetical protein
MNTKKVSLTAIRATARVGEQREMDDISSIF